MTNEKFDALFGGPPRKAGTALTQRDMDLAASIQAVTEEVVLRMARALAKETGIANLCLAGGVALNCVANGKVLRDGAVREHLDPARLRRRRRRARRGAGWHHLQGPAAHRGAGRRDARARTSARPFEQTTSRRA
jgi:carbamoyltransferase